jgi:ABC-type lipoprotein export system ATPase subunit
MNGTPFDEEVVVTDLDSDDEQGEDQDISDSVDSTDTIEPVAEETAQEVTTATSEQKAVMVVADGLTKYFRNQGETIVAVDNVSFTFTEGQFIAITGPSGCGKSTLLYILGGLDKATDGELTVDGVDVRRLSSRQEHLFRRDKLGFVFQSFHLVPNLSALENVMLPMQLKGGKSNGEMRQRAHDLLLQVGINEDRHQHKPAKLSGGQKQRVAIARSIANDPKVILADEPTGNLDSRSGKLIIDLLRKLARQGKTVVVVTHDSGIAKVADVRIRLEDGHIEEISSGAVPVQASVALPRKKKKRH